MIMVHLFLYLFYNLLVLVSLAGAGSAWLVPVARTGSDFSRCHIFIKTGDFPVLRIADPGPGRSGPAGGSVGSGWGRWAGRVTPILYLNFF